MSGSNLILLSRMRKVPGAQVQASGSKKAEQGEDNMTSASERYTSLMSDPLENVGTVIKNARKSK